MRLKLDQWFNFNRILNRTQNLTLKEQGIV